MSLPDICPYVGLAPFEASHEAYFFGRTVDSTVLADNVLARRTAVLYGGSGVGKSSVLNVGLPKALGGYRIDTQIVVAREWQDPAKLEGWLREVVEIAVAAPHRVLIVVLDQFEEYFLYRAERAGQAFEQGLAALLGRTDFEAHLLFSLRDDGLHQLDALRRRLPSLLDTTIELRHLDDSAVREAIEGPVAVYNETHAPRRAAVHIEDGFVDALMADLRKAQSARSQRPSATTMRIELPFLQLALERLWLALPDKAPRSLSRAMLKKLHGVDGIVRAHVGDRMAKLSEGARRLAGQMFHYLVTPSGGKFAQLPEDLAGLISESTGRAVDPTRIGALLSKLADPEARVLRSAGGRFELFHDILARPILDWRADFLQKAPFAYLVDVVTGDRHGLFRGGGIFGRLRAGASRSPLQERSVSRNHLLVLSDGQILDLRSRYGTTVNARTLLFGDTDRCLRTGDVIVLANTAALRFVSVEDLDGPADDLPAMTTDVAGSFAILIDGETRLVIAIGGQRRYLTIGDVDGITATAEVRRASFAAVERDQVGRIYITSLTQEPPLEVVERSNAFKDREWALARGERFLADLRNFADPRSVSDLEGAERGLFKFGDRRFEIIPNLLFGL